jgi:uncharacterized protein YbaR (Trm112 family)
MIKPELLAILCCPETHQPLTEATPDLLTKLNTRIAAAQLKNRAGELVKDPIEGALIRQDGKYFYPIRKEIPVMLIDQAIPLS